MSQDATTYVSYTHKPGGYALLSICREPVNSMNLDLWSQLDAALTELEANRDVRGVIFSSGLKRDVFTAGNDINELYAPKTSAERYKAFWVKQNRFLARLYTSRLVTVAAMRGASPAGGCITGLCCDYRILTEQGTIGLNEVALGIPVPDYWGRLMVATIGQRPAERLLQFGVLVGAQEALSLGLIDKIASNESLIASAEEVIASLLKAPDPSRITTKQQMRADFARRWSEFCVGEAEGAWSMLSHPRTVEALGAVLQRLSKPK